VVARGEQWDERCGETAAETRHAAVVQVANPGEIPRAFEKPAVRLDRNGVDTRGGVALAKRLERRQHQHQVANAEPPHNQDAPGIDSLRRGTPHPEYPGQQTAERDAQAAIGEPHDTDVHPGVTRQTTSAVGCAGSFPKTIREVYRTSPETSTGQGVPASGERFTASMRCPYPAPLLW